MDESDFVIKLSTDGRSPFTVMFEPSGMTYELAGENHMTAKVTRMNSNDIEIIHWDGGISVWAPGPVTTYDAQGTKLHNLN